MLSNLNHVGFNITKNKLQLVEVVKESSKYCLENVDEHIFNEEFDFNVEEIKFIGWGLSHTWVDPFLRSYKLIDDLFEVIGRRFFKSQATSLYFICRKINLLYGI